MKDKGKTGVHFFSERIGICVLWVLPLLNILVGKGGRTGDTAGGHVRVQIRRAGGSSRYGNVQFRIRTISSFAQ